MYTKIFIAVCTCAILPTCLTWTIFSKNTNQAFHTQFAYSAIENSFLRINGDKTTEFFTCPAGFSFNLKDMKCIFTTKPKQFAMGSVSNQIACPGNFRGTLPNYLNCRTFLDCWDGTGFEMPCSDHLLFNNVTKGCDWPEEANCCEFWEEEPDKLVADM